MAWYEFWRPKQLRESEVMRGPELPAQFSSAVRQIVDTAQKLETVMPEAFEPREKFTGGGTTLSFFGTNSAKAGMRGSSMTLQAYRENPSIFGTVSKIANAVADVDWVALQRTSTAEDLLLQPGVDVEASVRRRLVKEQLERSVRQRTGHIRKDAARLVESGDFSLVNGPSSLLSAWMAGNEFMSATDLRWILTANYLLSGGVYVFTKRNRLGQTAQMYPAPVSNQVQRSGNKSQYFLTYEVEGRVNFQRVPEEKVWKWRAMDPSDPYDSVAGFGGAVATEASMDEAAAQVAIARFANGGLPPGIIVLKDATDPDIDELKAKMADRSPMRDAGRAWYTNKDTSYVSVGETLVNLGLDELRGEAKKRIRQTAGLPPEIAGDTDNSNRATSLEARRIMAHLVVAPLLRSMSDFINAHLPQAVGSTEVLSYMDPMPDDWEAREKVMDVAPEVVQVKHFLTHAGLPLLEGERAKYNEMTLAEYNNEVAPAMPPGLDPFADEAEEDEDEDEADGQGEDEDDDAAGETGSDEASSDETEE